MAIADNLPSTWSVSPITGLPVRADGARLLRDPECSVRPFVIYNDQGRRLCRHRGLRQLPYRFATTQEAIALADRTIALPGQGRRR
jgi:hypothetical protein